MLESVHFPDWFWDLIEECQSSAQLLRGLLVRRSKAELVEFQSELNRALENLWLSESHRYLREDLGVSDDVLDDAFHFIVFEGRAYYDTSLLESTHLPEEFDPDKLGLSGVAPRLYSDRFGQDLTLPPDSGSPSTSNVTIRIVCDAWPSESEVSAQEEIVRTMECLGLGARFVDSKQDASGMTLTYRVADPNALLTLLRELAKERLPDYPIRIARS